MFLNELLRFNDLVDVRHTLNLALIDVVQNLVSHLLDVTQDLLHIFRLFFPFQEVVLRQFVQELIVVGFRCGVNVVLYSLALVGL